MTPMRGLLAAVAAIAVALAAWLLLRDGPAPQALDSAPEPALVTESRPAAATTKALSDAGMPGEVDQQQADFIAEMRARFGPVLDRGHARVRLIEQAINYLQSRYPDSWQDRVDALLAKLFPGRAAELQANYASLQQYNNWVRNNRDRVMGLPAEQRRAELWQARRAAFGPAADEIWAAELRNQAMADVLQTIVNNDTGSLADQASAWAQAVDSAWGGNGASSVRARRQTELVGRFVGNPAVQDRLHDLPPDRRNQTLREIRQAMGMQGDALNRWAALDSQRDAAWEAGQAYMQQRETIITNAPAGDQARQLDVLRQQLFGDQAAVIAQEEAAGFFRYAGERTIGRE